MPAIFGDPALLLGRLVPELGRWARRKVHNTLVVPNFNDVAPDEAVDVDVLAPTEPLWTFLKAVAQSRFVVGSSLHAIVVADALGVPARFVVSQREDPFKYRDYLAGTGRPTSRIAESITNALDLGPQRAPDVDLDALEHAFPWDLWGFDEEQTQHTSHAFVPDEMQGEWLERIRRGGSGEKGRRFVGELMPRLRRAAVENAPELDSLIAEAAAYRREVAPEATVDEMDADTQRIITAMETRDKAVVRTAALLGDSPSLAFLRGVRLAGDYLGIAVVLHHVPSLADATSVELVLKARSSSRVIRQPVILFGIQREQWHVDLEVLVEAGALTGEEEWTLAVEVDGPTSAWLDVLSAPPDSLGLLALERGDLAATAPLATVSAVGADVPDPSWKPRPDMVPGDV